MNANDPQADIQWNSNPPKDTSPPVTNKRSRITRACNYLNKIGDFLNIL
jgi:hypothetical protein